MLEELFVEWLPPIGTETVAGVLSVEAMPKVALFMFWPDMVRDCKESMVLGGKREKDEEGR